MTTGTAAGRRHTISALVQDHPGVLNRIVSTVRRRGINIASLAVGHSETPGLSRLTFVVHGDDYTLEQATKQLYKLVEVVKLWDFEDHEIVAREVALLKVRASGSTRSEIMQLVDIFRADIAHVGPGSLIIQVTGDEDKIDAFVELVRPYGLLEVMRSGRVAVRRTPEPGSAEESPGYRQRGRNGARGEPEGK